MISLKAAAAYLACAPAQLLPCCVVWFFRVEPYFGLYLSTPSLPGRVGAACLTSGTCSWSVSCMGRWPSVMGWVPPGLCLWTSSCMWEPIRCLECLLMYFSCISSPRMAAPQLAQQHAKIQLRTITPPNSPHTTGSAVCGLLLPTTSTRGPFTLGRGASGTLGKLRATLEAAWAPPPPSWEAAWEPPPATLYASFSASPTLSDTVTSGAASRLREIFASVTERARMKTRAQRVATPDISANADCNT